MGFFCDLAGKKSSCNAGDLGSIPGLGRSPGERDNTIYGVAKSQTGLSDFHFHFQWRDGPQEVSGK